MRPRTTDIRPENRRGVPVDPVPFLVVGALGFLACYSLGPGYLLALGVGLRGALALSTAGFLGTVAFAYYRFVWSARPDLPSEVPATLRVRRLLLGALVVVGVFALFSLPLLRA
ncbi:hypothetical protein NGM10_08860 [Halorussus salilacus]|uniref:hypothetical protein n=1 Tax=Halorussus salilacus TaxID=2953750 RepID=UPI00209DAB4C|nr:hypothetical protein [Halorussus salilacus]USZ66841.1 hypothetical protein NGM10_08860 [Halorussus salilacus]